MRCLDRHFAPCLPDKIRGWHIPMLIAGMLAATLASAPALGAGFTYQSPDGDYTLELGGRMHWDTDSFDGVLNREFDGARRFNTQLRRARLELSGTVKQDFEWVFDVNVNEGTTGRTAEFHALGVKYTGFGLFDIFVGRDKEPFGLEELISSNAITSIERAYFAEATEADSQPHHGVRLDGQAGPVRWSAGVFSPYDRPRRRDGGDRLALTGRVFGAPVAGPERTLHLGLALTDRRLDGPVSQRGFALDIAESGGELDASRLDVRNDRQALAEFLYLQGPWSLQAEVFRKRMDGAGDGPDGEVDAYYVQGSWTITGESRGYRPATGVAGGIKPAGPRGAVELVAKYDRIRFAADDRPDETVDGWLAGVNWYVNEHLRMMLNYIRVDSDGLTAPGDDRTADVVSTRLQFVF